MFVCLFTQEILSSSEYSYALPNEFRVIISNQDQKQVRTHTHIHITIPIHILTYTHIHITTPIHILTYTHTYGGLQNYCNRIINFQIVKP